MYFPTSATSRDGLGRLMSSTIAPPRREVGLVHDAVESEVADHEVAQAGLLELEGYLVDRRRGDRGDDRLGRDVGEERDLLADLVAHAGGRTAG